MATPFLLSYSRFMKVLKGYVRNPFRPEGCIAECYIAEEAIEFCSEFLTRMDTVGVPSTRNMPTNDNSNNGDSHFLGKPLGGGNVVEVDLTSWEQAHRCVLQNTTDVQPYIEYKCFPHDLFII